MLFANSIQEVMDFALIAQASTLRARVPFLHIFDGFRTSHEVMKIEKLSDEDIRTMIDGDLVRAHRERALTPDRPVIRGTAQNPDVFFQSRERVNPYYQETPAIVQETMDKFAALVGRPYQLFDYAGACHAERVLVTDGSAVILRLRNRERSLRRAARRSVCVKGFCIARSQQASAAALPPTVPEIAVLDRTKEPGNAGGHSSVLITAIARVR